MLACPEWWPICIEVTTVCHWPRVHLHVCFGVWATASTLWVQRLLEVYKGLNSFNPMAPVVLWREFLRGGAMGPGGGTSKPPGECQAGSGEGGYQGEEEGSGCTTWRLDQLHTALLCGRTPAGGGGGAWGQPLQWMRKGEWRWIRWSSFRPHTLVPLVEITMLGAWLEALDSWAQG